MKAFQINAALRGLKIEGLHFSFLPIIDENMALQEINNFVGRAFEYVVRKQRSCAICVTVNRTTMDEWSSRTD